MPTAYDAEIKMREKWKKKNPKIHRAFRNWRIEYKAKGPVIFAKEILKIDPNSGGPLQLSVDQVAFLEDLAEHGVRLAIITAGRGAGKTFVLAIYIIWRIATHEYWGISTMGGSAEQTEKIWFYIARWIDESDELKNYFLVPIKKKISTYANSYVSFHSCSGTSVRGPHTHELIIDEQAAGEEQGKTKFIKAAIFQVSTSPDIHIIKSSTAQFVHGDFLETWNNAEKLGYKKYQWSIAKHVNGNKDIYQIYADISPANWKSNVPWIPDLNISILRNGLSNDEWLVEALGGVSKASGLVFSPPDLDSCICQKCLKDNKPCRPYVDGQCLEIQNWLWKQGVLPERLPTSTQKALHRVGERVEGVDWGKNAPCAYTATGLMTKETHRMAYVLFSEETVGMSDDEKIQNVVDIADKLSIEIIRPDPREWSYNNTLANKGFAVHELFSFEGGQEKNSYLHTLKKFVERHELFIPVAFEDLIKSLKNLSYDKDGKVRKRNDHSFDSLLYAISYYGELADQSAFWQAMKEGKEAITKRERNRNKDDPNVTQTENPDVEIIEDFEKWAKEHRGYEKEKTEEGEEFPWGKGVNLW